MHRRGGFYTTALVLIGIISVGVAGPSARLSYPKRFKRQISPAVPQAPVQPQTQPAQTPNPGSPAAANPASPAPALAPAPAISPPGQTPLSIPAPSAVTQLNSTTNVTTTGNINPGNVTTNAPGNGTSSGVTPAPAAGATNMTLRSAPSQMAPRGLVLKVVSKGDSTLTAGQLVDGSLKPVNGTGSSSSIVSVLPLNATLRSQTSGSTSPTPSSTTLSVLGLLMGKSGNATTAPPPAPQQQGSGSGNSSASAIPIVTATASNSTSSTTTANATASSLGKVVSSSRVEMQPPALPPLFPPQPLVPGQNVPKPQPLAPPAPAPGQLMQLAELPHDFAFPSLNNEPMHLKSIEEQPL